MLCTHCVHSAHCEVYPCVNNHVRCRSILRILATTIIKINIKIIFVYV